MTEGQQIFLISCVGIPGVGKSTLLDRLSKTGILKNAFSSNIALVHVQEPSALWRERGWLAKFYEDPDMNAAGFQFLVFDSHVDAVASAIAEAKQQYPNASTIIMLVERSCFCQRLFWQLQVENGCTTANSLYNDAYLRLWSKWRHFLPEPNLILYFYTSHIGETMKRVDARDRSEEKQGGGGGLTLEYQAKLSAKHDAWYTAPIAHPPGAPSEGIPCLHINMDAPFHTEDDYLADIAAQIHMQILYQSMDTFSLPQGREK
jgi:deoxyadenosine/deoxycytidine kinase